MSKERRHLTDDASGTGGSGLSAGQGIGPVEDRDVVTVPSERPARLASMARTRVERENAHGLVTYILTGMNFLNKINQFLARSIALLNAGLAIALVLLITALSIDWLGGVGIIVGPLVGMALAIGVCGLLAVLVNIRDLLAELLAQQRKPD